MASSQLETQNSTQLSQSSTQQESQECQNGLGKWNRREKGKYDHLLKPNKNLAQSWGVDLSKLLSEYAASLDIPADCNISPLLSDVDEGLRVDFAEAALLLQGSTTIYCRKVEHLYNLVLAAVEIMNQVKARKSKSNGDCDDENDDDDGDDDIWNLEEIDFLDLDDVFPTADSAKILRNEREHIESLRTAIDRTKLVEVPPLLRVPSCRDSDVSGKGTLRMDLGIIDESGAMLLPGALESNCVLGAEFQEKERTPSKRGSIPSPFNNQPDDYDQSPEILRQELTPQIAPQPMEDIGASPFGDDNFDVVAGDDDEAVIGERRSHVGRKDPHRELDMHDDGGVRVRPIRVGCTGNANYRPKRGRRREKLDWLGALNLCDITEIGDIQQRKRRQVSFRGLREPARLMRRKIATAKRARYKGTRGEYSFADEARQQIEDRYDDDIDEIDDAGNEDNAVFDNGSENEANIEMQFENDMEHLNFVNDPPAVAACSTQDSEMQQIAQGYREACMKYVEKTSKLWEKKAENADLAERVEQWSSRIRPKLEEEDKRPIYDIQESGMNVLKRVHQIESRTKSIDSEPVMVSMKSAFQAEHQYEVCRMFLATLQLANNYQVEICQDDEFNPNLKLLDCPKVDEIRRPVLTERRSAVPDYNVMPLIPRSPVKLRPVKVIDKKEEPLSSNRKRRREPSQVYTPGRSRIRARVSFLR